MGHLERLSEEEIIIKIYCVKTLKIKLMNYLLLNFIRTHIFFDLLVCTLFFCPIPLGILCKGRKKRKREEGGRKEERKGEKEGRKD